MSKFKPIKEVAVTREEVVEDSKEEVVVEVAVVVVMAWVMVRIPIWPL
jgi:hypothetical protein